VEWDAWAAGRIRPPRIIGHEFSGVIEEVADDVITLKPGDEIASESHIVCGACTQCLEGNAHVCVNTEILGVDIDGGFRPYAVIPAQVAVPTQGRIPLDVACVQDPLGNAVHTALAGPVDGRDVLITGMGPIGLFAVGVCKAA
jgi:threonine 3-dehydrogenase